jgi:ribonuclease BN (tRNA processing enzyme)
LESLDQPAGKSSGLELLFLGTGNAFAMDNRYWGSILVNNNILLDASPIIVPHLKSHEKKLTNIEYIFLTHFHGDHFLGLPFLFLEFAYLEAPKHTLFVIGPSGVEEKVQDVTELSFPGIFSKLDGRLAIEYHDVSTPRNFKIDDQVFQTETMSHGSTEGIGYKLIVGNMKVSYTGDTDLCDGVINLANDSNILIIEMSNPYQDVPGHMNLNKLKILQDKVGPGVKIILNHVGVLNDDFKQVNNVLLPNDGELLRF